jgi:hypothetical protein
MRQSRRLGPLEAIVLEIDVVHDLGNCGFVRAVAASDRRPRSSTHAATHWSGAPDAEMSAQPASPGADNTGDHA